MGLRVGFRILGWFMFGFRFRLMIEFQTEEKAFCLISSEVIGI